MKKRIYSIVLICIFVLCAGFLGGCSSSKTANWEYWQKDAATKTVLEDYMKEITNKNSENYIPVKDRIAVFDLDGTLYGEKSPTYAIWQTFVHRALNDPTYQAPDDVKAVAEEISKLTPDSKIPDYMEKAEAEAEAKAFAGMNYYDYADYVKTFLQTDATGFSNLKLADAFFQPMLELIKYLQANDFVVYIVSGTDRFWVRAAIDGVIDIPRYQVIGTDSTVVAEGQGDQDGLDYQFQKEHVLRGNQAIIKNVKMNKVCQMVQELGQQPVLAFGNSSGDASMLNFAITENPYLSMAFMVLADDTEREYGNTEKAEKMKETCDLNGWRTISMKDDWATIYGENVQKSK